MNNITEDKIDSLIKKWMNVGWLKDDLTHPQLYIMAKGIEDIVNQAQQPLRDDKPKNNQKK